MTALPYAFALLGLALLANAAANTGYANFVRSPGALCLDGTSPLYYFAEGTGTGQNKWYIHHQGGGWCSSDANCYQRSLTSLGSTSKDTDTIDMGGGYFSNSESVNPMMFNWNKVFMRYCDGGSFSGANFTDTQYSGHQIYYRGKLILEAVVNDLLTKKGLTKATDVVISGCSAGGLATFLHVDYWRSMIPTSAKVVGLPDSGFFLAYESSANYATMMRWVYQAMNSSSGVNEKCVHTLASSGEDWKCIFAQYTAPFIQTPLFAMQSEYDSWQIQYDLASKDPAMINKYGTMLVDLVKTQLLQRPQHGAFLDSCEHHCGQWNAIVIDGDNIASAFSKWYDSEPHGKQLWFQNKTYPCQSCCKP